MKNQYKQFDVVQVDLNPIIGSEQSGVRPCIVLQTNAVEDVCKTTIIAPLTTKGLDYFYPYEVEVVKSKENGLKMTSKIKMNHIRSIDRRRILHKIGTLEKEYEGLVFGALDIVLDRLRDFRN